MLRAQAGFHFAARRRASESSVSHDEPYVDRVCAAGCLNRCWLRCGAASTACSGTSCGRWRAGGCSPWPFSTSPVSGMNTCSTLFLVIQRQMTLSLGLAGASTQAQYVADFGLMFAGLVFVRVPTMLVYAAIKRPRTSGITPGALKRWAPACRKHTQACRHGFHRFPYDD